MIQKQNFLPCYLYHVWQLQTNCSMRKWKIPLQLEKSLVKKFPDFDFSKHATCTYLPNLSTCLSSPLVSFLHTLHVLSTQPSSTYCPSTNFKQTKTSN